jgi:hypothetical protein
MKSFIAALRELTLPFGAVTGARIVLDGVNGRILIYDANGTLIEELSPDVNHGSIFPWTSFAQPGMLIYDANGDPRILLSSPDETPPFSAIQLLSAAATETNPGGLFVSDFVLFNRLVLSPGENNGKGSLELTLRSTSSDDSEPAMLQMVGLQINPGSPRPIIDFCGGSIQAGVEPPFTVVNELCYGVEAGFTNPPTVHGSYPRGMITGGYAEITANSNVDATGNTFDINGLSITCDYEADRWYLITCNLSGMRTNVANDETQCLITDSANAQLAANSRNRLLVANSAQLGGSFHYLYTPLADAPSKVFKIRMDRITGTGSVGVGASATSPSFIMAQDIGGVIP